MGCFWRQRRRLYHVAPSAIKAHATTAPMTGPAIHASDGSVDAELVSSAETAFDAVADGPETDAVFLKIDPVLVELVDVVVVVWKSVSCHRIKTALAFIPPEVVMLVTESPSL